jgi:hypothetical protein
MASPRRYLKHSWKRMSAPMLHMIFRFASSTAYSRLVAGTSVIVNLCLQFLNLIKRIQTNIAYFPASEPPPASGKRREAYEAGGLLPCPMDDPEGWFALPTATMYGVLKINEDLFRIKVDCTVNTS